MARKILFLILIVQIAFPSCLFRLSNSTLLTGGSKDLARAVAKAAKMSEILTNPETFEQNFSDALNALYGAARIKTSIDKDENRNKRVQPFVYLAILNEYRAFFECVGRAPGIPSDFFSAAFKPDTPPPKYALL